ncbi:uncharacterized protein [Haliotis cracherodii]|uniref:uncharacterized protein n=1 Tax=Haliotis cracherodii TaxID=6455 RepID=UPI0039ECDA9B
MLMGRLRWLPMRIKRTRYITTAPILLVSNAVWSCSIKMKLFKVTGLLLALCCLQSICGAPVEDGDGQNGPEVDIDTEQQIDSEIEIVNGETGQRRKRAFFYTRPWPDKIIPYVFSPNIPAYLVKKYRGFMQTLERNTCIRFIEKADNSSAVPEAPNTRGWVYIYHSGVCSSYIGYSANGRTLAPCAGAITYAHEFGHMLGLVHELKINSRQEYVNALLDNAGNFYRPEQELASDVEQTKYASCGFSSQSIMMYNNYLITKYGWPTYTYLYPGAGRPSFDSLFLFFKEISINHQCCGEESCDSTTCANEGYMGNVEGTCQCVCPPGLDSRTQCTTVLSERYPVTDWPSEVSYLAPKEGCPDASFSVGTRIAQSEGDNAYSSPNTLAGLQSPSVLQLDFCTNTGNTYSGTWTPGTYCFFNPGLNCSDHGFDSALYQVNEAASGNKCGSYASSCGLPDGDFSEGAVYQFCCRDDRIPGDKLILPNDFPFTLMKTTNNDCMEVAGMNAQSEYFIFDQAGPSTFNFGDIQPSITASSGDKLQFDYCRYEPVDYNCGGMFDLSDSNTEQYFSSPGYPNPYGSNTECNWLFKAPEGSRVLLECSDIAIGCDASFTVSKNMFGEGGVIPVYSNGDRMSPVLSIANKLRVTFSSGIQSCAFSGFECTAKLAASTKLPHSLANRGEEYCGQVNYAVSEEGFAQCRPWSEVFEADPSLFAPFASTKNHVCGFESNYCRNVRGLKLMPYCATSVHLGNVTFTYCDVGQFIQPFDVLEDCSSSLSLDPTCSDPETRRVCFKECKDAGLITDYPAAETPAQDVSCGEPTLPEGTTNLDVSANGYKTGDSISVKCNSGDNTREFVCLSNGQWSTQDNFCAGCPAGFIERSGNCYKFPAGTFKGIDARAECAKAENGNSVLVYPESQTELEDIIVDLRDNVLGLSTAKLWFGITPSGNGWISDYDNAPVTGSYLWKNGAVNGIQGSASTNMAWLLPSNHKYANKLAKTSNNKHSGYALCKLPLTGGSGSCNDKKDDCGTILSGNPQLRYSASFAKEFCEYTSGNCEPGTCTVPTPPAGVVADATTLETGDAVKYECGSGYVYQSGNRIRACQRDGTLTGSDIICGDGATASRQMNYYELSDTRSATSKNQIIAGPSPYLSVAVDSKVKACRAYCRNSGTLNIQFWRLADTGVPKDFTLRVTEQVQCVEGRAVTWTFSTPLSVKAGDFVGVHDKVGNLVTMHPCRGTKTLSANNVMRSLSTTDDPAVGDTVRVSDYPTCITLRLDCFYVPDAYTGADVQVAFHN